MLESMYQSIKHVPVQYNEDAKEYQQISQERKLHQVKENTRCQGCPNAPLLNTADFDFLVPSSS